MEIRAESLKFRYEHADSKEPVLDNVSFTLEPGECVALVGPSGSGKSTLAQHLNGLLKPCSGRLRFDGRPLNYTPAELKSLRRHVGLIFQFPEAQIFEQTVFDEVAYAARQWGMRTAEIKVRVVEALRTVGLQSDDLLPRNPLKLSGGEARLVSIASLLIVNPDWLILDEPTLGLDLNHLHLIENMIVRRREQGCGVLLITHDLELVARICPRTLVLGSGQLRYDGSTLELLEQRDLQVEFGLATPEIIKLWKMLLSEFEAITAGRPDVPVPDSSAMQAWIGKLPAALRSKIFARLQQNLQLRRLNNELSPFPSREIPLSSGENR